jgi:hypothetical protein
MVETSVVARATSGSATVRIGRALLVVAALLVGAAIVNGPTVGRALNGVGGLAWVVAAALLGWGLRTQPRAGQMAGLAAVLGVVLAAVVRPDDLVVALIAFGAAGALVGVVARGEAAAWAMLVPALYLPAHVIIAIGRSVVAGSLSVRTEPPPTAAIVPLAIVLAAAAAGLAVRWIRARSR